MAGEVLEGTADDRFQRLGCGRSESQRLVDELLAHCEQLLDAPEVVFAKREDPLSYKTNWMYSSSVMTSDSRCAMSPCSL